MATDPRFSQLYDDAGFDPDEEMPVRAADTFPLWGRALAWLTWRCPMWAYLSLIGGGVALSLLERPGKGVALGLVGLTLAAYCLYARKMQPDPFRYMILLSQAPLPPEDVAAAAAGQPVPIGPLDRAKETRT